MSSSDLANAQTRERLNRLHEETMALYAAATGQGPAADNTPEYDGPQPLGRYLEETEDEEPNVVYTRSMKAAGGTRTR
jgi:hypothetical protein